MVYIESKIAKYVSENGSASCQIWFVHKGHLIKTRYDQVITEANRFVKVTYKESSRREKVKKEFIGAVCEAGTVDDELFKEAALQAKEAEKVYSEERSLRRGTEDALLTQKHIIEIMSNKLIAAQERKSALRAAEGPRHQAESSGSVDSSPKFFSEFSFTDIMDATRHFYPSLKIGEESSQRIYKGVLHGTVVAVKVIFADGLEGSSEYRQEVGVLSRLRHPNIVTLIGACPEIHTIIYEYLPNGSLEDRLCCQNNSSPLPWQTRIRIAAELCSALIFLHSQRIVHGHLKPSNILLDANFISKLSDFGTCYAIPTITSPAVSSRIIFPKGTFAYFDPEFQTAVEPTPQLDVYSFGIILLRLLTGKGAWGITSEVRRALDNGSLKSLLDTSAGDWPYLQALQLTHIALRCTEVSRKNRPDLESEVLRVLEPIRASCRRLPMGSHFRDDQVPPYFICPIFQASSNQRSKTDNKLSHDFSLTRPR
uniref:RING-type E3 ubiquitin transferase n=2 Tax=Kalanchoe fedtschenkoi TaxID=63787 RepID=A0A7N0VAB3_KALFE